MSLPKDIEFEEMKTRVLSRLIEGSVLHRDKALDEIACQKAVAALESFLYEAFRLVREDVLRECLLLKSPAPEIPGEGRKLIQGEISPIDVVTVGWTTNESCCSRSKGYPAPTLHLCGAQLERIGFRLGAHIGVFLGEKELILRSISGCDDGCDQSQEV